MILRLLFCSPIIQVNQVTRSGTILPDLADIVTTGDSVDIDAEYVTAMHVLLLQIISAYLCYIFGKYININKIASV